MSCQPLSILLINHDWLKEHLQQLGHRVVTAGVLKPGADVNFSEAEITAEELLARLPQGFSPDRLVYYDNSDTLWIRGLEELNIPKIFYAVDVHHHWNWQRYFAAMFDLVLIAQKDYLARFSPINSNLSWFPPWATRDAPESETRTIDVSFVGSLDACLHPQRLAFLRQLAERVPLQYLSGDYLPVYTQSKIVINQAVAGDLNFRVFEALACGALLITPEIGNGLLDLFVPERELVLYRQGSVEEAAEKISYYLHNDEQRNDIARRGWEKARTQHSNAARARELERHLLETGLGPKPLLHYGAAVACLATYLACQLKSLTWGQKMLLCGLKNLVLSASCGEPGGSDFFVTVAVYKKLLDEVNQSELALRFLDTLKAHFPENTLLTLAAVHSLVHQQREAEARALASSLPGDPQEICRGIDALLQQEVAKLRQHQAG